MNRRRIGIRAGLLAPPLFIVLLVAQDLLREDFDPLRRFISELAIGPFGWVQILNFLFLGASIMAFAAALNSELPGFSSARSGAVVLSVVGFGILLSGVFVADTPGSEPTWHGIVHLAVAFIVFPLLPISCYLFWRDFRADSRWAAFRAWTFMTAVVTACFWIIVVPGQSIPAFVVVFGEWLNISSWVGLLNRIVFAGWLLWLFMFALGLARKSRLSGSGRSA